MQSILLHVFVLCCCLCARVCACVRACVCVCVCVLSISTSNTPSKVHTNTDVFYFCFVFLFVLTISISKLFFNAYRNIVLLSVCYKYPYQTFSLKLIQILCCVCVLQISITKPFFKVDLIIACLVCVLPSPYSSSFFNANQSKQRFCLLCVTKLHIESYSNSFISVPYHIHV